MANIKHNLTKAERRKRRVSGSLQGTAERPRVSVFRSNKYVYIQAIDDAAGETVAATHDKQVLSQASNKDISKTAAAKLSAESLAEQLKEQDITAVVFDRGQYKYHGRVRAVAEALREAGIKL